jgi:hypothetical protein
MKTESSKGFFRIIATEFFPIGISIFSLILSTINLYINYLKSPDINFVVAPYITQLVDVNSNNEAFFIPLTVINRGARPGTVMSLKLVVTYMNDNTQADYYAQYYGQDNHAGLTGDFFTPVSLSGYSSVSHTICFYPAGKRYGNFFTATGPYRFQVMAVTANVQASSQNMIIQTFQISLTDEMEAVMKSRSDGSYPYPIPVETAN